MRKEKTVIYYKEETQEILKPLKKVKRIDTKYVFISKNPFTNFFRFIAYRLIATPIAIFYTKVIRRVKFVNKKAVKEVKKESYFVYANHTNQIGDAFVPNTLLFPKHVHMIANAANVSLPVLGKVTKALGAIPLPDEYGAARNFIKALEKRLEQKRAIVIYPERTLWPYATFIRPFSTEVMRYPVKFNKPLIVMTTTYQKNKHGKMKTVVYIDGPFYPNMKIEEKQARVELLNLVRSTLIKRAANSNFEKISYIKEESL